MNNSERKEIFNSQLNLLKELEKASESGRDIALIDDYYHQVKQKHKCISHWSFDDYTKFLVNRGLVTFADGRYFIAPEGRKLVEWLN